MHLAFRENMPSVAEIRASFLSSVFHYLHSINRGPTLGPMLAAQQAQPRDYHATTPGRAVDGKMWKAMPSRLRFSNPYRDPYRNPYTSALGLRYYLLNEKKRRLMERLQRIPGVRPFIQCNCHGVVSRSWEVTLGE